MKKHFVSSSYSREVSGEDCFNYDNSNETEPCWGQVLAIKDYCDDLNNFTIYGCEGHINIYTRMYIQETIKY